MMTRSHTLLLAALGLSAQVSAHDVSFMQSPSAGESAGKSATHELTHATSPQEVVSKLSYQAQDKSLPTELRVGALRNLANYPSQNALVAVSRNLQESDPALREAAIVGAGPYNIAHRWRMVSPLLTDDTAMVRLAATVNLLRDYGNLSESQQQTLNAPTTELIRYLEQKKDTDSQLLLADVYRWYKQWDKAQPLYQQLTEQTPDNPQVWLSLAENYRAQKNEDEAIGTLDEAIQRHPSNAALHYSKALTLVRLDDKNAAAQEMELAANMAENNSYYWYLNGVLQEPFDVQKSVGAFEQAYLISGAPEQLYAVCDIYARYDNPKTELCLTELQKVAPEYVIDQIKQKKDERKLSARG
ncbi:tetratricopeptide repeat protein [Vibrio vulnificus]|nr:tetratricopeptide repeat protein [Vibrio vulnificus]EII3053700.1 tetratricopeptide repeat protein [Vibrio vulnificus]EKO5197159.1 tetratricopeptide repeat protein [Vibrio vulnificus]ELF6471217.1 tetratricopeptide repeat protein [Vibrio vulnificus]HAS8431565.1 tetratricopeptide repeat protein [Vibrio vulnificus]